MKLLTIGHNFVLEENQKHLVCFADSKNISDVCLITPQWWVENTQKIYQTNKNNPNYTIYTGETIFTTHNTLAFYYRGLLGRILAYKPDMIEVWEEPWSLTLFQIVLIKIIFRLKAKITCYSAQNIDKKFPFPFNMIQWINLKNVSGVHVCSDSVYQVFKKKYNGIIKTIGLGLDFSDYEFKKKEIGNPIRIGYVGRLTQSKGVFDLLEAINKTKDSTLTLCGAGSDEEQLKLIVKENEMGHRVFFSGSLNKMELIKEYHKMDILVVPSKTTKNWKEQFGRIIVEAYATGVIVVGSDSGSIPELIGSFGLTYPEGDVDSLIACIKEVIKNKETWYSNRLEAKNWVEGLFSWQKIASQLESFYMEVKRDSRI
ncbi:MAG: hypothetical protein A2Y40_07595 [Candidatus Margulisbacteria bacterium GWF2_35_9]|nr:MAG: hypothetical protein A2Y40_07595 [Candidatus Margulisbacteria bacterium GWF2_35_9]